MDKLAFLTCHKKGDAVTEVLASAGYMVVETSAFDTARLGTFSGEVERERSAFDTAVFKARTATELLGCRFGLGSEGSFGPDPHIGLSPWGLELLVWWDAESQRSVHAVAQGPETNYAFTEVSTVEEAYRFADQIGFPEHGLMVGRPGEPVFSKAIDPKNALRDVLAERPASQPVWLSTDMRAHRNPTRRRMIARAAWALAMRLGVHCPHCRAPGFGVVGLLPGAICQLCGTPTRVARAEVCECSRCGHRQEHALRIHTDPSRCDYCNP